MPPLRMFIALDTPPSVKLAMAALRDDLAAASGDVRWERSGKFHCTVRFLGSVPGEMLDPIGDIVREAASDIPPLRLAYRGIGFFPDRLRPHVIWIGVRDDGGDLARLGERIEGGLRRAGFAPEDRPFHPHVTLGRVARGGRAGKLIESAETRTFDHPPVIVPTVEIMQSVPGPGGTVYTVLRSIPLEAAPS